MSAYTDTLDKLRELNAEAEQEPHSPFGDMGPGYISLLLDHPELIDGATQLLRPYHFSQMTERYVAAVLLNYHERYGQVPTREILRSIIADQMTVDDPHDDVFRLVDRRSNPREVPMLKDKFVEFLRHQTYAQLFSDEGIEAYHRGEYGKLDAILQAAGTVGVAQEEAFGFVTADAFMQQEFACRWLVEGVVAADQPMLVGGRKKSLKTGIICDLAVSLASGTPFLDHFPVPQRRNVAFFSCESGQHDIQQRLKAICEARDVVFPRNLHLSFQRIKLSNPEDLLRLTTFCQKRQIDVVMIDPLYLTLLAGNDKASSANLFDMGGVFSAIADACAAAGVTPILVHHFRKSAGEDLDLDDFSFTGAAEFARQSLLIQRSGEFTGPENNLLRLRVHGFARGNTYSVRIDENRWATTVEQERETKARERRTKDEKALSELRNALLELAEGNPAAGVSQRKLREALGWSSDRLRRLLELGQEEGFVEAAEGGFRRVA